MILNTYNNDLLTDNYLSYTDEKIIPFSIWGFDIETYGENNIFLMGSIVNDKEKFIFWNREEMINFLTTSHKFRGNSLIFATNLGFDFMALFGNDLSNYDIEFCMRGSSFINIKITLEKKYTLNFRDTMNFLKTSVSNLGDILKIPKLDKPKFLGEIPKNNKEKKELEIYNIRDSEITFKFANFLQDSFNKIGCNIKFTIASTSMSLFRNKYLKEFLFQPKKEIIEFLYKAYYGGRTETISRGKIKNMNYYDINSLYPYVMLSKEYPHPNYIEYITFDWDKIDNKNKEISKKEIKRGLDLVNKFEGVSYCLVKAKFNKDNKFLENIPILPYRDESLNKLVFPLGYFESYQTHVELRKAINLGYEVLIFKSVYYEKTFNPFKDFVTDNYNKRLEEKKKGSSMDIVYKLILNSLYGKFAQKMETTEIIINNSEESKEKVMKAILKNKELEKNKKDYKYKIDMIDNYSLDDEEQNDILNPQIYFITDLDKEYIPKFINPILSIYITSYARLELFNLIETIKKNKKNIVYFDTDSVITDYNFNTSKDLGALKKEYDIKEGIIIKPKMYYLKGLNEKKEETEVYKCKGLMGINSYKDFENIISTRKFNYIKFCKFKESLRRKLHYNKKISIDKDINLEDNKRVWKNEKFNKNILEESTPIKK